MIFCMLGYIIVFIPDKTAWSKKQHISKWFNYIPFALFKSVQCPIPFFFRITSEIRVKSIYVFDNIGSIFNEICSFHVYTFYCANLQLFYDYQILVSQFLIKNDTISLELIK